MILLLLIIAVAADFYSDLGVSKTSTLEEITSAFKTLAVQYHPDKNPEQAKVAKAMFDRVTKAYEILSNDETRESYDNG